jgi:hypothetical protein
MKTLILLLFVTVSFAQIRGKVVDFNGKPLVAANVYFDGTTVATLTDKKGDFIIDNTFRLNTVLVVSFLGYQTQYLKIDSDKELYVVLKEVAESLNEVIIKKDLFTRKQKMELFRDQFLGRTSFGKASKIENESDIYFIYDKDKTTLKAFSQNPLIIVNSALGYKITYELSNFETKFWKLSVNSRDVTRSFFSGLSRFEENNSSSKIIKNREKCYSGSQLEFFRNLRNETLGKGNFLVFEKSYQVNPKDSFTVRDTLGLKRVEVLKQERGLHNKKFIAEFSLLHKKAGQSKFILETSSFYIDQFGLNSNIEDISFSGKLSEQRVGNMLPANYKIN